MFKFTSVAIGAAVLAVASAAVVPGGVPTAAAAKPAASKDVKYNRYFEVRQNNRIYVFAEHAIYEAFKSSGELAYVRTKIGAGPNRETLVFGINKDQASLPLDKPVLPEMLWNGRDTMLGGDDFFAILERDNRYYLSDNVEEFQKFHMSGEAAYARTQIGGGPGRKTLVFVHAKDQVGKPLIRAEQLGAQLMR